ncbi:MAG TPA: LUD domain-containing protein [Thermomicrobiales bacterium]|nr:LUD domain-containing protein [Thermomicrobiales bacterium]
MSTNAPETVAVDPHAFPPFRERYEKSLANARLAANVSRYQTNWRVNRDSALQEIDFEDLRMTFKGTKTKVQDQLDQYIAQFQEAAERAGAIVHHAVDAEAANRIAFEICQQHEVRQIVKSKSMVTEEIELNHYLESRGIECVETDLGEWIVQKAGQRPSHIVGPALHMGREDVGELLNTKLHVPVSNEDIPEQVHTIRDLIRPLMFSAGAGMTGANALIAETGTVMMCTNEGNGRMASSVPPVHIVLAGIEKLIPTFDDAVDQLRLLGRSGTGQRMTVYTTFITGPTPGHEMHIILVDNGRRKMRAMPEFREALHCIRCGACANVCPPYREVGGHVFGHIYTGAIGLVVTQFHHGLDAIAKPQSMCLSCNACETVCPVGIPLPQQIIDTRKMVVARNGLPTPKRVAIAILQRPRAFSLSTRFGKRAQFPLTRGKSYIRDRSLPKLNRQTTWRSLPAVAPKALTETMPLSAQLPQQEAVIMTPVVGKTAAVFPGCMTDRLYPEQGNAVIDILRGLGMRVVLPAGLNCCGLPASNMGDDPAARKMAKQTIRTLEQCQCEYIVSGSASCVAMIMQDYIHIFRNDPDWRRRAVTLAAKVRDLTSFLVHDAQLQPGALKGDAQEPIVYHDSCQGLNALGLETEPKYLLREVMGMAVEPLTENRFCCGFGGSFGFDYPEVSERLMNRKLDYAAATGAKRMVTDNQGCIMHLRGGCDAGQRPMTVSHIAELIAHRIREKQRTLASR